MKNIIVLFVLFIFLTNCTKEEWDCLQEKSKIITYYDDLIEDATGNVEEQKSLRLLKEKELENYDCLYRWNEK